MNKIYEESVVKMFIHNIEKAIYKKGITQKELAEKVGVTEVSMSRYLNGKRIPKAPIMVKIAKELNTTVDDLFDSTDDTCDNCAFSDKEVWEMPCEKCKRNCKDYWRCKA